MRCATPVWEVTDLSDRAGFRIEIRPICRRRDFGWFVSDPLVLNFVDTHAARTRILMQMLVENALNHNILLVEVRHLARFASGHKLQVGIIKD